MPTHGSLQNLIAGRALDEFLEREAAKEVTPKVSD